MKNYWVKVLYQDYNDETQQEMVKVYARDGQDATRSVRNMLFEEGALRITSCYCCNNI